jgi:hypothetical protein
MHFSSFRLRPRNIAAALVTLLVAASLPAQEEPPRPEPTPPPQPATLPAQQTPPPPAATSTQREDLPLPKDIIEQSLHAMGGRDAFHGMTSSFAKAQLQSSRGLVQLEMSWMRPNLILVKQLENATTTATIGFNGEVAWAHDSKGYQILPSEQATLLQREASMFRIVPRMETDLKDLKTIDQVQFAGSNCYKVSGIDFEGAEHFTFFDVADHLVRGAEVVAVGQPTLLSRFSEWKEDQGIKYFSKVDIEQTGSDTINITFTEVKFNTLDESVFALPPEVQAMLKDRQAPTTGPDQPTTAPATLPESREGG